MGCMLRSDKMTKAQMYLQEEVVFDVIADCGEMGCVQFIDLYPELQLFHRNFVMEVCRFSEMERKIDFIIQEINNLGITIPSNIHKEPIAQPMYKYLQFEAMIEKLEKNVQEMTANEITMLKAYYELCEYHYVLTYTSPKLGTAEVKLQALLASKNYLSKDLDVTGRLMVVTAAVRRTQAAAFELSMWRVARGIIYYERAHEDRILIDPQTRTEVRKVAVVIIVKGEQLARRIEKVCHGYRVNTFPCPNSAFERKEMAAKLYQRITDLKSVLLKTRYIRCKLLLEEAKDIQLWKESVIKSKSVYHTMNMFRRHDTRINSLVAECWIPDDDVPKITGVFQSKYSKFQSQVFSFNLMMPNKDAGAPTYHRTNAFTNGFQALINAYGDSTYRELNPGLYTIITFPFLFAMMFGDVGHGFILVLFGAWMVKNEKSIIQQRSTNEIWNILFGGRYIILLMGLFSCYTGFFYNDLFSRSFIVQDSYWMCHFTVEELQEEQNVDLDPMDPTRCPYAFGEDPMWRLSKNKIMFENSFKMKISIIIGIIHMMFGIVLSLFNYIYFKKIAYIFFQFLPELLFLTFMFFWLVIMIFMKWLIYSPKSVDMEKNVVCAPQILILFIDMVLMSETQPANEGCTKAYIFEQQRLVQTTLVLLALLCIPVLLLGTPVSKLVASKLKIRRLKAAIVSARKNPKKLPQEEQLLLLHQLRQELLNAENNKVDFPDLMIHQGVHTIEFVLSTISHTASYLRLWALSLAHSQLSEMLWDMILSKLALQRHDLSGAFWLIPIFTLWAFFTVTILVVMEGLSAFLHCLRLHWVEFMSKFYGGGGWPFRPFSFEAILAADSVTSHSAACKKFATSDFNEVQLDPTKDVKK